MPTFLTSARYGVQYPDPATRSASADVPRDLAAIVAGLERSAMYTQGTFATRPVSSAGTPGIAGRFYYATDTAHLYYDFGTGWLDVTPGGAIADGSITTAKLADAAVTSLKIADGTIVSGDIADGTIVAADLAPGLFPSQGAGAATEALRALGTAAGTALAGNSFAATADVTAYAAGPLTDGNTFTIQSPIAGTYIVSWGGGLFFSGGQGASATIDNNKVTGVSQFGDVGGSGGPVTRGGVVLAVNEVITFTVHVTAGSNVQHAWARLTRTA